MNSNYHVIFGTGPVGMATMEALCARGESNIRMVNRSGKTSEPLPTGVELVNGDASNHDFAIQAAAGATHIYNTLNPPYSKWVELFPPLQAAVIAAAEATSAKLIVMDNLYMYGEPNGKAMTEDMPYNAHTKKGKLRAQMSRDLLAAHQAGRVQAVVGRASDFIGPRVRLSAMGEMVLQPVVTGKAAQALGNIDVPHSYTYMPDIGRALVDLALADNTAGQVWHLPTPPALTTRQLLEKLYAEAGHPLKVQVPPKFAVRLLGLFNANVNEMVEMLYEFEAPFVVDDSKFTERFGWHATDWETIVRETVAWYRAQ